MCIAFVEPHRASRAALYRCAATTGRLHERTVCRTPGAGVRPREPHCVDANLNRRSDRRDCLRPLHGLGDRRQRCGEFDGDLGRLGGDHRRPRHPDCRAIRIPRGVSGRRRGHLDDSEGHHRCRSSRKRSRRACHRHVVGSPGGRRLADGRFRIRLARIDHALDRRSHYRVCRGHDRLRRRPLVGRDDNCRELGGHPRSFRSDRVPPGVERAVADLQQGRSSSLRTPLRSRVHLRRGARDLGCDLRQGPEACRPGFEHTDGASVFGACGRHHRRRQPFDCQPIELPEPRVSHRRAIALYRRREGVRRP